MNVTFDALDYFEKLKAADVPEKQAKVMAETMRVQSEAQITAMNTFIREMDEKAQKELATKGDLRETELRLLKEIEHVRAEIEHVRAEIEHVRAELKTDMEKTKYALLKWQIGGWLALAAIMAKGFGWAGF